MSMASQPSCASKNTAATLPAGLILDWGGVLCVDPAPGFIRHCSQVLGADPKALGKAIMTHMDAFQKGAPESEFWSKVCADCDIAPPARPLWGEALAAVYVPLSDVHDLARELRAQGVKICLLTNTEPPSRDFHLALGYEFFDARVFSCDESLAKPDPAIYRLAASRLGLATHQCLMVDDKRENIEGARLSGMHAHLFLNLAGLKTELGLA